MLRIAKLKMRSHPTLSQEERAAIRGWASTVIRGASQDSARLALLAKVARKKAEKLEEVTGRTRRANWRRDLGAGTGGGSRGTPTRAAFSWTKGPAVWPSSPVGDVAGEEEIPDEDRCEVEDEVEDEALTIDVLARPANGSGIVAPRCMQGSADSEASGWAEWWKTEAE